MRAERIDRFLVRRRQDGWECEAQQCGYEVCTVFARGTGDTPTAALSAALARTEGAVASPDPKATERERWASKGQADG